MKPGEELANLKRLLRALKGEEPGYQMFLRDGEGHDLTQREIGFLEKDIQYLEKVVERARKNG